MASILIADDDEANRALMQFVLQAQGGHQVTETSNAAAAAQVMEAVDPDLVVLDVMMPGISGLEFSRTLRRKGGPPILMVSGLGGVEDRITGLRSGADDYLPKPFDPAEFLERVNALLRRARRIQLDPTGATVRAGHLRLRPIERQLWVGDRGPLTLTATECRLLYAMMTLPETVWSREELLGRLWDIEVGVVGAATSVESYVAR